MGSTHLHAGRFCVDFQDCCPVRRWSIRAGCKARKRREAMQSHRRTPNNQPQGLNTAPKGQKSMDVKQTAKIGQGAPGPGRKKGVPNKVNADLKAMILGALDQAGGEQYLLSQAHENPKAFLSLLARVLPLQVAGTGENGEHKIEITWRAE